MRNWKCFFTQYRLVTGSQDADLLYQVGKTSKGKIITPEQFALLIQEIKSNLDLRPEDHLLDLCCGNGVLTYELARYVRKVTGLDFSAPYIQNARRFKQRTNITYAVQDIRELAAHDAQWRVTGVNKFLMSEALAYFYPHEIEPLLRYLSTLMAPGARLLIHGILDHERKWRFFDTWSRRLRYLITIQLLRQDPGLGRWWKRKELVRLCAACNLRCEFLAQDPRLPTAHYRVDALITPQ